jgi:glycosyltransferase involved in cell wall biosynthesis
VRIAHVIGSLLEPLGGAEQYVVELARTQTSAGHEVTVVTGWASATVVERLRADGVSVQMVAIRRPNPPDRRGSRPAAVLFHALDLVDSVRTPRALRRALDGGFDVVHAHRVAGLGAAFLRSAPAPVVVTVHDYSLVDTTSNLLRGGVVAARPPLLQRLRTRVMSRAVERARMIFPSDELRERHRAWGLRVPGSEIVPHGWRIGAMPGERPDTGPVIFLFLGKLLPTKGIPQLLEAWGDGIPGAELWIAGAGPLEDAVAAAPVRALGWLDATGRDTALAAASAMVLPSTGPEIFLLAAAEGALAGMPVISTAVAAPPAVRNGESGILTGTDPADLRAAMVHLMDPAERARLAAGARAFAADLDLDRHLDRVLAVYAAAGARVEVSR